MSFPAAEWLYTRLTEAFVLQWLGLGFAWRTSPGDAANLVKLLREVYSTVPTTTSPPFSSILGLQLNYSGSRLPQSMTDIETLPVLPTGGFGEQRCPQPA